MTHSSEIAERIQPARNALDALRYFVAMTRGFRDREQKKLARFLREVAPLSDFSEAEVVAWLKTKAGYVSAADYRDGDTSRYRELLRAIPHDLQAPTLRCALDLARGSGRRRLSDEFRSRVEIEFTAMEPMDEMPRLHDGSADLYGDGPEDPFEALERARRDISTEAR